jgi:hypothetical protein
MRLLACALCFVLSMVAMTPRAFADDASESRTRRELGQEYYRQGRYQEALDMFLEAYRLVQTPTLAHDLAQTYALLDRPVQAFNWYQTFLRVSEADTSLAAARTQTQTEIERLRGRVGLLDLTSDPPGAEIFVDRVELGSWGTTPLLLAVPAGHHALTARAAGHHDATAAADATLGTSVPVALTLAPILGHLAVTSEPPGATVTLEQTGAVLGTTPLEIDLPIGVVSLRAAHAGWIDDQRTATIVEGQTATIAITLAREASTVAVLSVDGTPAGAHVLVDGTEVGVVPMTVDTLAVGHHVVRVEASGMDAVEREVLLEAGGATRIAVTLRPPPEWAWPVLRWVGYGVGAATVIVGGVMGGVALSQRDAFFASPSRSALDAEANAALVSDVLFGCGIALAALTLVLDLTLQPPAASGAEVSLDR